jgi:hypothetical protein
MLGCGGVCIVAPVPTELEIAAFHEVRLVPGPRGVENDRVLLTCVVVIGPTPPALDHGEGMAVLHLEVALSNRNYDSRLVYIPECVYASLSSVSEWRLYPVHFPTHFFLSKGVLGVENDLYPIEPLHDFSWEKDNVVGVPEDVLRDPLVFEGHPVIGCGGNTE